MKATTSEKSPMLLPFSAYGFREAAALKVETRQDRIMV
jgi:hypothetical protein